MKRQIVSMFGVLGLLLVAACANAQSVKVKANVPFDFVVDKATLPAGDYSIDQLSANSKALAVRNHDAGAQMIVLSNTANRLNASGETCLVFHRYGERYFLSQIWIQGEAEGLQLSMSKHEAEIAKNLQRDQDIVIMAALR